ncbi:hypothetical protein A0256_13410 [Mucilaginibacter sp. PAMC 26640]|nr:hypothetical protein A0256_13410 [Mucilaginibacter sp. PAMC 26640]
MKVLINALLLNDQFSGIGHFTKNLVSVMAESQLKHYNIETLYAKDYSGIFPQNERIKYRQIQIDSTKRLRRIYYEQIEINKHLEQHKFDLYHTTNCIIPYFSKTRTLLTVHDLVALDHPEYCKKETVAFYRALLPNSIKNATKIVAVSNKIKEDILQRFIIDPAKIEVIHHGVGKEFKRIVSLEKLQRCVEKYKLPPKFLLFIGNLEPRKNLVNLIDAYIELKIHSRVKQKLVIAGANGWKNDDLYAKVLKHELANEVIFTGYVDQCDIPSIYSLADLFIFPSLYEGFGLPVLEAMACGTPVLCSNRGALPEVTGSSLPHLDPLNVSDIAKKILLFLNNSQFRSQLVDIGFDRVKQFTWEQTVQKTLNVYDQILYP